MKNLIFIDYWVCNKCVSEHYGMCLKCEKCGRKFDEGVLINSDEYPSSENDD